MTEKNEKKDVNEKKTLTLSKKTDARTVVERDQVRQQFAYGKSKTVEVEVRRKRYTGHPHDRQKGDQATNPHASRGLTGNEFDVRMKALRDSIQKQKEEDLKKEQQKLEAHLQEEKLAAQDKALNDVTKLQEASHQQGESFVEPRVESQVESHVETPVEPSVESVSPPQQSETRRFEEKKQPPFERRYNNQGRDTRNNEEPRERSYHKNNRQSDHKPYDKKNVPQPVEYRSKVFEHKKPQNAFNKEDSPYKDSSRQGGYRTNEAKQPFVKENIRPIVLRASSYGAKPKTSFNNTESIVVDPILEKNQGDRTLGSKTRRKNHDDDEAFVNIGHKKDATKAPLRSKVATNNDGPRKLNRNVLSRVLDDDAEDKGRSLAAMRRARQKQFKQSQGAQDAVKLTREVIIPETITVGELANRMAVRGAEVVKVLMNLGMMVTINQVIDNDTAELVCGEFGHTPKRVADSDIEIGLGGTEDNPEDLQYRAPVVTVMGHVDHGKTSLLDALRATDVVSGEAGGITQHIGAYQVTMKSGKKITFIDTPGHAAFSEMRARGANATDIVVLVVAADDGIMAQTIEAINHAKAANVPIVVAINKMDKLDADPARVRGDLLQHGIVLEEFGGDVMSVEVSAKQKLNLEKLEETILLQAEVLELKANPKRQGQGVVIEAKIDKGRGTVATVLIQKGTLEIGQIFVAGTEWGRVKALVNDHGQKVSSAGPSVPIEILGFNGVPAAGDEFFIVDNEQRAREIAEYRFHRQQEKETIIKTKGGMENIMNRIVSGDCKELPIVIKADVQGSVEAIQATLSKLATEEVKVRVLHGAVGGINESDITLAKASKGIVIGFNVRANPQTRELAKRDEIELRYYSIIYDVIDDIKSLMGGMLAPTLREKYIGSTEIRNVFTISKVDGKVAGCYVTDGMVKRGAKVRLLRDSIVVFEGSLKSLKRFKDEVKEVKESYECGIVLENFDDIKVGDVLECFEIESIARQL